MLASSKPSREFKIKALLVPSFNKAFAIKSIAFLSYTPISWILAFAGFVIGPSILKIVF